MSLLLLKLLNKMVLLRERTGLSKKWPVLCFTIRMFRKDFGLRQSTMMSMWLIEYISCPEQRMLRMRWNGRKPNVKYFRTFKSNCYILKDWEHHGKFDSRIDEWIFLGYYLNSKAYQVFNLRNYIVMDSINVVVDDAGSSHFRMMKMNSHLLLFSLSRMNQIKT